MRTTLRKIDLIILDEAHEVLSSAQRQMSGNNFRAKMSDMGRLMIRLGAKRLFLTGTLPISSQDELKSLLGIEENAAIVRVPFTVPGHSYMYVDDPGNRNTLDIAKEQLSRLKDDQKAILFFKTKDECISASVALQTLAFHADIGGQGLIMQKWRSQGGALCATSAMIAGVDVDGIVLVIFMRGAYSTADLFQGFGRARGLAKVMLIGDKAKMEQGPIRQFAEASCKRQFVDSYFNGGMGITCSPGDNACDGCVPQNTARPKLNSQTFETPANQVLPTTPRGYSVSDQGSVVSPMELLKPVYDALVLSTRYSTQQSADTVQQRYPLEFSPVGASPALPKTSPLARSTPMTGSSPSVKSDMIRDTTQADAIISRCMTSVEVWLTNNFEGANKSSRFCMECMISDQSK